jgi:opacity protein-like surface antigen
LIRLAAGIAIALVIMPAAAADLPSQRRLPPAPEPAAPPSWGSFYIGTRQGFSFTDSTRFASGAGTTVFDTRYDAGRQLGVVAGYAFAPMFGPVSPRLELEGSYGNPGVKDHKVNGVATLGVDSFGELRSYTGLLNGYLDFNLGHTGFGRGNKWLARLTPFVGAGIGVSQVSLRKQGVSATGVLMDGTDTRMTWQVSAGVSYRIWDRTQLEIGYRHMRTEGLEFAARDGTTAKTDLTNNIVTVGVRRSF